MMDVMEQLRAAQPTPRGERLARAVRVGRSPNEDYMPRVLRRAERMWMRLWRRSYTLNVFRHDIRAHAAPLALARERRRRERAEDIAEERKSALFQAWADEQATSAAFHERGREIEKLNASAASRQAENRDLRAERDALRAEVARLEPQPITGDTSDGYHTFNELYAHRIALWKAVCRISGGAWRSKKHSDGSGITGWFVLGMGREPGSQCTYHLPDAEWEACAFAETLDSAPTFDGHTSEDVLARIDVLQPPTREEVERAVAEVEESYDALIDAPALDVAANSRHQAARAALVKLATRSKE